MAGGDRRCATCGAAVGVLVDVCPSCGGDPDLRLLELGAGGRGRRRGPRPPAPGDRHRPVIGWKRWTPVIAALLAVWGFLALTAAGGRDDDDDDGGAAAEEADPTTSTTERRRRTGTTRPPRTTTTTEPLTARAPLLGEETGLTLVIQGDRPRLIDLDTGVVRMLGTGRRVYGATGRRLLAGDERGQMRWLDPPYDRNATELIGDGDFIAGWVDPDGDVAWFVGYLEGVGRPTMQAFELDGTPRSESRSVPSGWPVGVIDDDIVVAAAGGTFLVEPDGDASMLSSGQPVAVAGDLAVVIRCEGSLECFVEATDRQGDVVNRVAVRGSGSAFDPTGWGVAASPSGRIAEVVNGDGGGWRLYVDGSPVEPRAELTGTGVAAWSPDGRWLFVVVDGGRVVVLDGDDLTVVTTIDGTRASSWAEVLVLEDVPLGGT